MTIKCFNKPNRTTVRTYTAKDVGRITCYAINAGVSKQSIQKEIEKCLGDVCKREEVNEFATNVIAAMAALTISLAISAYILAVIRNPVRILRQAPGLGKLLKELEKKLREREIVLERAKKLIAEATKIKDTI